MKPLSRRTLLRGTGAALALPWFEAMAAKKGPAAKPPIRMAAMYMPNGVHPDLWTPAGEGRDFLLSSTLQPLQAFKMNSSSVRICGTRPLRAATATTSKCPAF